MIPLWTTAIVSLLFKWGCELTSDGSPCVAHLVCPIPIPPSIGFSFNIPSRFANLPLCFSAFILLSSKTATPAESYPLYSNFDNPSTNISVAFFCPTYPTIPHILFSSFPFVK